MAEQLDTSMHSEILTNNALLVQNISTNAGGFSNAPRLNYESDNENDKPVLLELGVSTNNSKTSPEISTIPYPAHYPLNLQLNSAFDAVIPAPPHTYNIDPAALFHNPYTNRIPQISPKTSSHASTSPSLITLKSVPYPAHIPQTVYTWSTPTPVTSVTPVDENDKIPTEIVSDPVCMTYSDVREHTITKQQNHYWKEKALQNEKDYKKTACDRERTRMRDMNRAFDQLRSKLPISKPNGKKYSKIESLRIAINYINHLQRMLRENMEDNTALTTDSFRFDSQKSNTFLDAKEKFESFEESRSTWSDNSYLPNSQDKWD